MSSLSFKDFATDQEVRWCPGCGDYSILKAVQRTLADSGCHPPTTVFVSGIGCSSRLPYYVNDLRFSHHSWPRTRHCHRRQTGKPGTRRLGDHRRRRRSVDRR